VKFPSQNAHFDFYYIQIGIFTEKILRSNVHFDFITCKLGTYYGKIRRQNEHFGCYCMQLETFYVKIPLSKALLLLHANQELTIIACNWELLCHCIVQRRRAIESTRLADRAS
jgi:hypothetical protein